MLNLHEMGAAWQIKCEASGWACGNIVFKLFQGQRQAQNLASTGFDSGI